MRADVIEERFSYICEKKTKAKSLLKWDLTFLIFCSLSNFSLIFVESISQNLIWEHKWTYPMITTALSVCCVNVCCFHSVSVTELILLQLTEFQRADRPVFVLPGNGEPAISQIKNCLFQWEWDFNFWRKQTPIVFHRSHRWTPTRLDIIGTTYGVSPDPGTVVG